MNDEQKLLNAYRASDERGQQSILETALSTAEDWPSVANLLPIDSCALPGRKLGDLEASPVISSSVEVQEGGLILKR